MNINDSVKVKQTKRIGKIIDTQKSTAGKTIYIVRFHEYYTEGFFEEELEIINNG